MMIASPAGGVAEEAVAVLAPELTTASIAVSAQFELDAHRRARVRACMGRQDDDDTLDK
jgi:hypothetical protein